MMMNPVGTECGCGSFGCWETEIGERALLARAGRPPAGGRQAVDELIAAAAGGDAEALASLAHVGRWLGIGLVSLVNIFNPTLVVLGGIFERIHPHIRDTVDAVLDRRALRASRELVRVSPGSMGIDGPLIGAAELAFEQMLADPAARLAAARARRPAQASA
jgi:predicted NBD/HSP70 family sugar kinase